MSDHEPYGQQPPGHSFPPPAGPPGGGPPPIPQYPGSQPPPGPAPGPPPGGYQPSDSSPWNQVQPPAYAQPPRKKRRLWLWLLIGIPLLFALLIGGCVAFLITSIRPAADATNEFVAHLDNGEFQAAYDSLCSSDRGATPAETWIADTRAALGGEITDYNFNSVSVVNNTAEVSGTISIDGDSRPATFDLIEEDGEWRVCGGGL